MGSHVHGTASEWFSAGITLHELLTGRRPFEASRLQAFRYCKAPPPPPAASGADEYYPDQPEQRPADSSTAALPAPRLLHHPPKPAPAAQHQHQQLPHSHSQRDLLWPEHLYQHCDYLSAECKDFVRGLLIPDVSSDSCSYIVCSSLLCCAQLIICAHSTYDTATAAPLPPRRVPLLDHIYCTTVAAQGRPSSCCYR